MSKLSKCCFISHFGTLPEARHMQNLVKLPFFDLVGNDLWLHECLCKYCARGSIIATKPI